MNGFIREKYRGKDQKNYDVAYVDSKNRQVTIQLQASSKAEANKTVKHLSDFKTFKGAKK